MRHASTCGQLSAIAIERKLVERTVLTFGVYVPTTQDSPSPGCPSCASRRAAGVGRTGDSFRPVRPASPQERERLLDDFVRLCEIESPSRRERRVADAVKAHLQALGLEVEEDDTAQDTGSEAGNLLARIPAPDAARTILLCAHLDTVPLAGPVEVKRENGVLSNRHQAILGADNKAAVATVLGAVRRGVRDGPPPALQLPFTT